MRANTVTDDSLINTLESALHIPEISMGRTDDLSALMLQRELPIDQNPVAVYLASLAPGSRRTMSTGLRVIAALLTSGRCSAMALSWGELRYQHTAAIRSALSETYSAASANKMLAALRGVLKAAWRLGQIPTDEYHRAIDWQPVRGESLLKGRALVAGEIRALFDACAQDRKNDGTLRATAVRDAAALAVLYGVGLRRSEVVALNLSDYDTDTGGIKVQNGKGNKARIVYASRAVKEALAAWLELRGLAEGPLFYPVLKSGQLVSRRLTDQAILNLVMNRGEKAGIKHFSPHDLRRTFISDLLDAGADISVVQKLAGHANVTTTTRYDRRGEVAKQKAVDLLHVPFTR
jgi:integrase